MPTLMTEEDSKNIISVESCSAHSTAGCLFLLSVCLCLTPVSSDICLYSVSVLCQSVSARCQSVSAHTVRLFVCCCDISLPCPSVCRCLSLCLCHLSLSFFASFQSLCLFLLSLYLPVRLSLPNICLLMLAVFRVSAFCLSVSIGCIFSVWLLPVCLCPPSSYLYLLSICLWLLSVCLCPLSF